MQPFPSPLTSRYATLPVENVDTDQIIPARFLKTTDKTGLGAAAFHDWRYEADGTPRPDFVLNRPEAYDAAVLVAGHNFGCGSSREHAPWALLGAGIQVVVSSAFADIFCANALKNGLLPVHVSAAVLAQMMAGSGEITVDLEAQTVTAFTSSGTVSATFPIDPFAKHCLLHGVDQLGFLLALESDIVAYERVTGKNVVAGMRA